jgi:hypothetical protein
MNRKFLPFSFLILLSSLLPVLADPVPHALDLGAWKLETLKGATATLSTTTDGPNGAPSIVVQAQTAGSTELWLIQLDYPISVLAGKKYHLKFSMKSDPDHYVYIGVSQIVEPYAGLCDGKSLELNSHGQDMDYTFTPKKDESNARILVTNLNAPGSKFYIANMTLTTE